MRDIIKIIDQIVEVAPDLEFQFMDLKSSVMYSAPELYQSLWVRLISVLNSCAPDHPEKTRIQNILSEVE
jgi:hypothetical protein